MILAKKLLMGINKPSSKDYLEFVSSTPMTITPNYTNTGITLQYSLNTKTWINIAAKGVTPSANIIYFRGSATGTKSLFTSSATSNAWLFNGATNLEAHGDITMLLQDTLGGKVSDIRLGSYAFAYMFNNCTKLIVVPALSATTLADNCYRGMFNGCSSLTVAPTLPATTLAAYCYNSMLGSCTSLTVAPTLPATTLADNCYGYMFNNCTKLTVVPALSATTLANSCYGSMLRGCTKIKLSTTKTGSYQTEYRVPTVGTGVNATNALKDMFINTGGTFVGTPTINTTYYTENILV